jgi:hypothetical protein
VTRRSRQPTFAGLFKSFNLPDGPEVRDIHSLDETRVSLIFLIAEYISTSANEQQL